MSRRPSPEAVATRVASIKYEARTRLDWGDPRRVHEGGGALRETRRAAERARKWLSARGFDEAGAETSDDPRGAS